MMKVHKFLWTNRFDLEPLVQEDALKLADLGADPDVVKSLKIALTPCFNMYPAKAIEDVIIAYRELEGLAHVQTALKILGQR